MNQEVRQQYDDLAEKLLSEQNFGAAVVSGAVATVLAAVIYGVITSTWNFAYSFAAAGIGIVIGLTMQYSGRGITTIFAVMAGVYTVAGCMLGNFFTAVIDTARTYSASPIDVLLGSFGPVRANWFVSGILLVDLVFWTVAVSGAVFLVKRPLSRSEGLAIHMYAMKG